VEHVHIYYVVGRDFDVFELVRVDWGLH
jgi:hypothetical protein